MLGGSTPRLGDLQAAGRSFGHSISGFQDSERFWRSCGRGLDSVRALPEFWGLRGFWGLRDLLDFKPAGFCFAFRVTVFWVQVQGFGGVQGDLRRAAWGLFQSSVLLPTRLEIQSTFKQGTDI